VNRRARLTIVLFWLFWVLVIAGILFWTASDNETNTALWGPDLPGGISGAEVDDDKEN